MTDRALHERLKLRRIQVEDIEAVLAVEEASFSSPWPVSSYRFEVLENQASRPLLAELELDSGDKQVVGLIIPWLLVDEAHIANIAVHPDHRRQGIACQLVHAALLNCAQRGAEYATLEVRASNEAAQGLYARFGFEPVGLRKGYYKDNGEDAVLMTLRYLTFDALEQVNC